MAENKGTEWFLDLEAECDSMDTLNDLFDESTDSDLSNFIDNEDQVDEAVPLALFNKQNEEDCNNAILELKRKYVSPARSVADLSPRLEAVSISPQRQKQTKRKLFDDSGIEQDEAEGSNAVQVETPSSGCHEAVKNGAECSNLNANTLLLTDSNRKGLMHAKCKELYGVPYTELTRTFKSDKTCCNNWVMFLLTVTDNVLEGIKVVLQQYCEFIQILDINVSALLLLQFKSAKSRETIQKLFQKQFNILETNYMCDPPRVRSAPAAIFFYHKTMNSSYYTFGSTPDWIAKHISLGHTIAAAAEAFDLSKMIQWAYDNKYYEDHEIAYQYAREAETDPNAAAFLNSNCQAKYVKECVYMVRLYRRYEQKHMTMSQWIQKCCDETDGIEDWKTIACLLRYQNVNVISFLTALRTWLQCIPKKQCILIWGPPDTGKSYFCYSMVHFLKGQVVSFMNRSSHFWLQPLQESKVGFIDDGTYPFWEYVDINMRAALDGNPISVDIKHKAHCQMRLPPLLVTSNINIKNEMGLKYLHSRVTCFEFPNKMLLNNDGTPVYKLTDKTWKSFFTRLALQLGITFEEDDETDAAHSSFCCTTRRDADIN